MATTHPDHATSWRDLADELTPKQVQSLESMERRFTESGIVDHPEAQEAIWDSARNYAESNLINAQYADVPVPDDAELDSAGWEKNLKRDGWSRSLVWQEYAAVGDVAVSVDGRQQVDGSFDRHISVWAEDCDLTSSQTRQLAAILVEAADEFDRLSR